MGVWKRFGGGIHVRPPLESARAVSTGQASTADIPLHRSKEYWVAFLQTFMYIDCPIEVCTGREITYTNLQLHSMYWHVEATIVVFN